MFVTTQGEYALRCLMTLASRPDRNPVTLKELSRLESISKDYVGKLLNRLKHAGLVEPIHGSRGGYRLAREASRITVKDVYLACERDGFKVFCLDESFGSTACRRIGACGLRDVWKKVYTAAYSVMEGVTLEELALASPCGEKKELS
jgi:Rrf2 family protein